MRPKRYTHWELSCGHIRAISDHDGPSEAGDTARCYECPAAGNRRIGYTAPMKKLIRRSI